MYERDVEAGLLSSRPSEPCLDPGALNTTRISRLHQDCARDKEDANSFINGRDCSTTVEQGAGDPPAEDDEFIKLPRRKVEQLMGMWVDMLQRGLIAGNEGRLARLKPIENFYNSARQPIPSMSAGRYPPISYAPDAHPWRTVEPMAEFELEAENRWRSLGRAMWKTPENLAHLEDSWKHVWEPMVGVDRGLFQWPIPEETRRRLQDELVDALNANERIVTANMYMRRDYRTISSFITLIGLRLNEQYRSYHRHHDIWPVKQIQILIECIWACNAFDPSNDIKDGYREGPRLSNVLTACYKRRIFLRPEDYFNNHLTKTLIQRHCQAVRRALHLINLLQNNHISEYARCENLTQVQQLWSMPLPDVEAPPRILHRSSTLREGADSFLRIDDFNLKDLYVLFGASSSSFAGLSFPYVTLTRVLTVPGSSQLSCYETGLSKQRNADS